MTLNAKKNKPRVNCTGKKIPEEKSEENSYQGNTRKNIFNVYPRECHIFSRKAQTRNSKFLATSGDFLLAMSLRDFHESILFQQTGLMMCSIKSKEELTISRKDLYAVLYDQQKSVTHRDEGKYNNPWSLNDK